MKAVVGRVPARALIGDSTNPGGPNFYKFAADARYDINIDPDGEGGADLTYRWTFKDHYRNPNTFLYNTGPVRGLDDQNLNFRQTYDLELVRRHNGVFQSSTTILRDAPVAPSNVGQASMPDYARLRDQAVRSLPGGGPVPVTTAREWRVVAGLPARRPQRQPPEPPRARSTI